MKTKDYKMKSDCNFTGTCTLHTDTQQCKMIDECKHHYTWRRSRYGGCTSLDELFGKELYYYYIGLRLTKDLKIKYLITFDENGIILSEQGNSYLQSTATMMMQAAPIPPQAPFPEVVKAPPLVDVEPEAVILSRQATPDLPLLHDLTPVDRLLITKRLRVKNVLFLRGKRNRFFVRTSDQTLIYTIEEENRWWVGYFCYGLRPLQLRVTDGRGTEVMRIHRPYSCTARILPCQLQHLEVYSPPGQLIGSIEQQWTPVKPTYIVKNDNGVHLFWIRGPYITVSCFRDVQFQIVRPDGAPVGTTCKRWQGLTHALFFAPVTDKFGIAFERALTVEEKGLLLAATLLMDYMYYDA